MIKIIVGENFDEAIGGMDYDIAHRISQKEDLIIYLDKIEDARFLLTPERLKLLGIVKRQKPDSLYALAKLLKKDIKTIATDTSLLNKVGLLRLEKYKEGERVKVRPRFPSKKITIELSV